MSYGYFYDIFFLVKVKFVDISIFLKDITFFFNLLSYSCVKHVNLLISVYFSILVLKLTIVLVFFFLLKTQR